MSAPTALTGDPDLDLGPGPRRRSTLVALLVLAALVCAGFVALGAWQVQRLAWKQALLARIAQHQQAAVVAAPTRADWPDLRQARDEYRQVRVQGRFDPARETLVHASTALGSGYWVLTPLRTAQGDWLWVNRGFVPPQRRDPALRGTVEPSGDVSVEGRLRWTEPAGSLLQHNDPGAGRWYSRDVAALSAARGLRGAVAPYFIDAAATATSAEAWPRPGLTVLHFSNNHRVYAFTWFALAALTLGAAGLLLWYEQDLRRALPARSSPAP